MTAGKRLVLVGGKGMLAAAVLAVAGEEWDITSLDLPEFDLADQENVNSVMREIQPDVIVNCAAYTNVDGCESEEALATRVNGVGPGYLAAVAKDLGATLVQISTDYVFDGLKSSPYMEEDMTHPQSGYGRSKLAGEKAILESGLEKFFIIRTSWLYGPGGNNFVETILRLAKESEELRIVADQVGSPTFTHDLANAIYCLLLVTSHPSPVTASALYGIYHFSNNGQCSWYEFAQEIVAQAQECGEPVKVQRVLPIRTEDYPLPATRPTYSVFSKEKYKWVTGAQVSDWRSSLSIYFKLRRD